MALKLIPCSAFQARKDRKKEVEDSDAAQDEDQDEPDSEPLKSSKKKSKK
jgi:hypothetical protein